MMLSSLLAASLLTSAVCAATPAPVEVMILATFHLANPGQDLHNQKVPDVLVAESQAQLKQVGESLARFKPSVIDVEWPAEIVKDRYGRFLQGTLEPSRNEVVQLGFRVGLLSHARVVGIDTDGDFPYDAVQDWAKTHGRAQELDAMGAATERTMQEGAEVLAKQGIARGAAHAQRAGGYRLEPGLLPAHGVLRFRR